MSGEPDISLDLRDDQLAQQLPTALRSVLARAIPEVAATTITDFISKILGAFQFRRLAFAARPTSGIINDCSATFALRGTEMQVQGCSNNLVELAASVATGLMNGDSFQSMVIAIGRGLVDQVLGPLTDAAQTLVSIANALNTGHCAAGQELVALLCYTPCAPGYVSDGATVCYRTCPAGTTATPGFCNYPVGSAGLCPGPQFSGIKPYCINQNRYSRGAGLVPSL